MEQSNTAKSGNGQNGVIGTVKERATAQLSTQKNRATDGLGSLANAVRQSSRPLRDNQQDTIAEYVEKAADQIERLSSRLREREVNDLVNDAQQFARRQPALFIGGAFAAGMLAARFLKSSADSAHHGALQRYDPGSRASYDRSRAGVTGSSGAAAGSGGATGYPGGGL